MDDILLLYYTNAIVCSLALIFVLILNKDVHMYFINYAV